jgi:serine phosphatase RsbU (regulator of sigma subunit)
MAADDKRQRRLPAAVLAAGALLFGLGLALALARLPEWRLGQLPDRAGLRREVQAVAARLGLHLTAGGTRLELCERSRRRRLRNQVPITSAVPSAAVAIRADQAAVEPAPGVTRPPTQRLEIWFDPAGRPQAIDCRPTGAWALLSGLHLAPAADTEERPRTFAGALLGAGEGLGRPARLFHGGPIFLFPITGTRPPEHVTASSILTVSEASRNPGDVQSVVSAFSPYELLEGSGEAAPLQLTQVVLAGAFLVLAIRRRLSLANGAWLAAVAFLAVLPGTLRQALGGWEQGATAARLAVASAWLAVLWAAAESLWRTADPRFDASLDLLRARRLTARSGGALLAGCGLGAAAAGLGLAAGALAAPFPGVRMQALSVDLPIVDGVDGPLAGGILGAAVIAFFIACGRRFLPRRWVPVAAGLAAAVVLWPVRLHPWPLGLVASLPAAGALVAAAEAGGLTALLAAALAWRLLPAATFAALHASWLPGSLALTAGALGLLLGTGVAGVLGRPRREDETAARPPAFILRLERERRLEVEMELLARMQRGLLPSVPELPGWEIAARSLLADRAGGDLYDFVRDGGGRWWIAAGDVAGHGYSCAIAQAMVKAALASLVGDGGSERDSRTPAWVLAATDRVLRTGAGRRSFTSLALLRLDTATGEALLANAGHPYPLLLPRGEPPARELELPGLPLGQGPPRSYADLPLTLAPGTVLVLCSDGIFEAMEREAGASRRGAGQGGAGGAAAAYGWERARAALDALAGGTAAEVLEGLLADWRHFRGESAPADDTTIVVVRRRPAGA